MSKLSGIHDAVSDVLELVRMQTELVCVNEYSAPWSYLFAREVAHFHIVERGAGWLEMRGSAPLRIETGDLVILPLATPHVVCDERGRAPEPIGTAAAAGRADDGLTYRLGGGGVATHMIAGQVRFDGVIAPRLMEVLPPLIHVKAREGKPLEWLRLTSHFLVGELRAPKAGSSVMITRLLDLLFVQAFREWGQNASGRLGWLAGIADPPVGRALTAIHADPARRWTVEALADIAGLSRSAFAARFAASVGETPLKYVLSWRLELAADHLRAGLLSISRIAEVVGYGSEPALTRAFKSRFGETPAVFRRSGRASLRGGDRIVA
jgi:AraC-like DNA-binding protein